MTMTQQETYGLIGEMKSVPGKRADLLAILRQGTSAMPGNLLYLIAEDRANPDSLWFTEVWTSEAAHRASLDLPEVQAAIAKARPLIAGFGTRAELRPVAGVE